MIGVFVFAPVAPTDELNETCVGLTLFHLDLCFIHFALRTPGPICGNKKALVVELVVAVAPSCGADGSS